MTATVISLESRIRNPKTSCGCPRHLLLALSDRVRTQLDAADGELLIDRGVLTSLTDDVLATVSAALDESQGRTNP